MATLKGAFLRLGAGLLGALPNIVVFQFNPDRVTRTPALRQRRPESEESGKQNRSEASKPHETYSFVLRLDAADQLAAGNPIAATSGILPTLSALELLMVPRSPLSLDLFSSSGQKQPYLMAPDRLPTVLFVWGPYRVLPVNVTSLSIVETEYDPRLNPVRAEVTVNLEVLTPEDLADYPAYALDAYTYTLRAKEAMAALNLANAVEIGLSTTLSFPI